MIFNLFLETFEKLDDTLNLFFVELYVSVFYKVSKLFILLYILFSKN